MSTIACIGCYDDESETPIRRNGKTATTILFCYKEKMLHPDREVFGNLHTSFGTYLKAQQIIDLFLNQKLPRGSIIIFDEVSYFLNNLSADPEVVTTVINGMVAQSGKMHWDIFLTMQRFGDIPRRLRPQCDRVIIPVKTHLNGEVCYGDFQCKEKHLINVYSEKPYRIDPISIFDPALLIDPKTKDFLYDSEEVIYDTLVIGNTEKKRQPRKKALCAEDIENR